MADTKISVLPAATSLASTDEFHSAQSGTSRRVPASALLRKNAIINGDFNIWQRGTSFAAIASGAYSADRFVYGKTGDMVHTVSRSTDVPTVAEAGRLFNYSILIDCTTVDAAIAAGDHAEIITKIEGFNWLPLAQRATVLSFWVKATKTGTYCIGLNNSGNDRSYVAEYTVNTTNTWEKKTIAVPASPSAGTWDYTNGVGLQVVWTLAAGSTFHTTPGAWQTGNFFATSNQVNACDSAANNFQITGIQQEPGSVATEFDYRTFQGEKALCDRYFQKTFLYDTPPVQNAGANTGEASAMSSLASNTGMKIIYRCPVLMRASPTVVTYNPAAANVEMRNLDGAVDDSATSVSAQSQLGVVVNATQNAASAATHRHGTHLTLEAEL